MLIVIELYISSPIKKLTFKIIICLSYIIFSMARTKRDLMKLKKGGDDEEEIDVSDEDESSSSEEEVSDEDIEDEDMDEDSEEEEDESDEDEESEEDKETETIESTIEQSSTEQSYVIDTTDEESMENKLTWRVVSNEERITDNFLSDYEYVRALSVRAKHIALGAKILLKDAEELRKKYTPKEIAILEIKNKSCPLIIVREVPNGNVEYWDINELDILFNI